MKAIGLVLIVLGLVGLIYGGVTWTQQKKVVDLGPLTVTHDEQKSLPVPPLAGGVCLVAGVLLLLKGGRAA